MPQVQSGAQPRDHYTTMHHKNIKIFRGQKSKKKKGYHKWYPLKKFERKDQESKRFKRSKYKDQFCGANAEAEP
jgi:hypothetical protein